MTSSPRVKVYGELGFWLKACRMARHDTCQGLVWLKDKRDAPHYFHDTNAKMMIWKFYAKLVMHAPIWTLKCQKKFWSCDARAHNSFSLF